MNILFLGPFNANIIEYLLSFGDSVSMRETPLAPDTTIITKTDFLISYRYRHILKKKILDQFINRSINLHISLLPWNKGSDPNLWSFLDDTPKGVTIHKLAKGVDAGDILAQEKVNYQQSDSLKTSYARLSKSIELLFKKVWPDIRSGKQKAIPQPDGGSYHLLKERTAFEYLLKKGWETPVKEIIGKAKREILND